MGIVKDQVYKEERFEFALYVNNNIICKRNFKINDFIEHSMESLDFKDKVDEIVGMIDNDLKSKSRVYLWYNFNPNEPDANEEFNSELIAPWECTFKFEVSDNHKVMISKIWDGYAYPRQIREKVDISNRNVKISNKDGRVYVYDKESFFKANDDRLTFEQQVLKGMIMDKSDLLAQITKQICEACSVHDGAYTDVNDYVLSESYGKNANGEEVVYNFNIDAQNKKLERKWLKLALEDIKKRNVN